MGKQYFCSLGCGSFDTHKQLAGHIYENHGAKYFDELHAANEVTSVPSKEQTSSQRATPTTPQDIPTEPFTGFDEVGTSYDDWYDVHTLSAGEPDIECIHLTPKAIQAINALIHQSNREAIVNRLEVIDHTASFDNGGGRTYIKWEDEIFKVKLDMQDDGRTLKIFLTELEQEK